MSGAAALSERLHKSLALAKAPVAITFLDSAPANIATPIRTVPAGCSFWELGASGPVATTAADHRFCSIGTHTHNLSGAVENHAAELQSTLAAMQGLDYVRPDEVAALPVMKNASAHVVYAPLADIVDCTPSVVLLFAHAGQGLIISEALARVDGSVPPAMGRPACAFIPQIMNSGRSAASLGCCGARAYIDALTDDIALWGLHGEKLGAYVDEIEALAKANDILREFHDTRRVEIEAGGTPTVEESLSRLG